MKSKLAELPVSRRAALLGALAPLLPRQARAAAKRPNFLVILSDDIGWGDFRCYNSQGKIPTPNLDRMAREGMRFTDAHSPAALCAPTRYTVVTGNYTWRGRRSGGTWGYRETPQFLPGQKTVGHILQSAGYRTAMFGKTHFGGGWEKGADGNPDFCKPMSDGYREWGFDYSYGLLGGHQAPPYFYIENNRMVGDCRRVVELPRGPRGRGRIDKAGPGLPDWDDTTVGQTLAEKAASFLDDHLARNKRDGAEHPFFMHFCTDGAHSPYDPPDKLLGSDVKGASGMTAHTDMVHEVDVLTGKLVEALARRGLLEDTVIVVTSDNGGLPFERERGHDAVGGLRGSKSSIWEGGHRVPFIVRWGDGTARGSKIAPGSVRNQVVGIHDIVPTFAELAGARVGEDQALDSVSLAPVLLGKRGDDKPVRETLLIQSSPGRDALGETRDVPRGPGAEKSPSHNMAHALREGSWKLNINIQDQPAALFDLAGDLAETKNLIDDPAQRERVQRMTRLYREIRKSRRSTPPLTAPGR
jgi:arylsulfatase A-like enzyme